MYVLFTIGVGFCSNTNGYVVRSGEELKSRNLFDGTVIPLISLRKDISKQHVLSTDCERWHWCGTCQTSSDGEVSNGVTKAVFQW